MNLPLHVCLLILTFTAAGFGEEEDGVLVLTKDNFKDTIADNEFILVEFYAPWCGHCKALAPEYSKAAKTLKHQNSNIKLAKVDATLESELAEQFGIRGYPTLKFFKNGIPMDYNGGRQADDIVIWLQKKTGPPAKALNSKDEVKDFIEYNNIVCVGFFKDQSSELAEQYKNVAILIDDIPFGITSDDGAFTEYDADDGAIMIFKNFDEKKVSFEGESSPENIKKFVSTNSMPLIVEFNHETAQKIFGGEIKSHLLLFVTKGEEHYDKVIEAAKSVAKPFREEVLFVTIDSSEEDHQRILEFFGMTKDEIPAARLIKLADEMAKYKPETTELTAESIKKFVEDFLAGKLKQSLLAQDLPEDWDKNPVKVLVSSNFDSIALDPSKDVLVEFYAPWCGHCKQLAPIYDQLGEHFKDDDSIVIAKMDATANELEHTKVSSFPTIKLYKKENNEIAEYNGPRTLAELIKFVESGGKEGASPAEEDEEDDDAKPRDEL